VKHTLESWEEVERNSTPKEVVAIYELLSPEEKIIVEKIIDERRERRKNE
jgi:hypothetical protein